MNENQEVNDILNAPTEGQLECTYCHELDGLKERFLEDGFIYDTGYKEIEFFDMSKHKKHTIEIKFCPMCGRRLDTNEN